MAVQGMKSGEMRVSRMPRGPMAMTGPPVSACLRPRTAQTGKKTRHAQPASQPLLQGSMPSNQPNAMAAPTTVNAMAPATRVRVPPGEVTRVISGHAALAPFSLCTDPMLPPDGSQVGLAAKQRNPDISPAPALGYGSFGSNPTYASQRLRRL